MSRSLPWRRQCVFFDPRLGHAACGLRLILQRVHLRLRFSLRLIEPGLGLVLHHLGLLLHRFDVFLNGGAVLGRGLLEIVIERFQIRFEGCAFTHELIGNDFAPQAPENDSIFQRTQPLQSRAQ